MRAVGRCDGATAGCEVSRPRLDGVEHAPVWSGPRRRSSRHIPYAIFARHGRPRGKQRRQRMRVPPRSRDSRSSFVASVRRFGPRDRQCRPSARRHVRHTWRGDRHEDGIYEPRHPNDRLLRGHERDDERARTVAPAGPLDGSLEAESTTGASSSSRSSSAM